ncbi:MAG: succinoglycan biosynthesis transport protein ExoP [Chitinophagales bacterium]
MVLNDSVNNNAKLNVNSSLTADASVKEWFNTPASAITNSTSQASGPLTDSLSATLGGLLHTTKENRWSILFLMLIGCIAGVFKAISETPVYQASLTMAVEPSTSRNSSQSLFDPYAYRFYETQYELLKSRSVAERVVEELDLVQRDAVDKLLVAPSAMRSLAEEFDRMTGISLIGDEQPELIQSDLTSLELTQKRKWLTQVIQVGVSVSGGKNTNMVDVTFNSINPEFAAEIANALVAAYIEEGLDSQLSRSQQTTRWFSQRIDDLRVSLDESQSRLQQFLMDENLLDTSRNEKITTSELQSLNSEYIAARASLDELAKRYGARHPKLKDARAEVEATKSRLDLASKAVSFNREKQVKLELLEREVKRNNDFYEAFLSKFKEADLSSSGTQVASARIIDRALPPSNPIYPQKQRIIVTWAFGGLFFGLGLAFLRQQLDTTFKNGRTVEDKLGLPLFGVIQFMGAKVTNVERHYLENTRSVFSEAINHIRTGVTYSDVDNPAQVLVITSSVQSEGKTTLASNLALSYAQLGKTLLIDADLRRPRIKHLIKTEATAGLVEYVAGLVSFDECVMRDREQQNLYILNSGTTPPNPLELLASERFSLMLSELRKQFTYIIIDTAPVLPASDAVVLGRLCDSLLLAIQSERTTHHMARDAIKRLNASNVSVAGLILTQANIKKGNAYQYGGYYGYGAYAYVEDNQTSKS